MCEGNEVFVVGNEVGFALEGNHGGEVVGALHEDATVAGFAVGTLSGYGLTLLADDFDSGFHVAVSFSECLFAVAKTCTRHGAKFLDIFNCYSHCFCMCFGVC